MKKIRICLDQYLEEKKISRYRLAKLTNMNINTISNYYKNKVVKYDCSVLERICTALDCDICDIIECIDIEEEKDK